MDSHFSRHRASCLTFCTSIKPVELLWTALCLSLFFTDNFLFISQLFLFCCLVNALRSNGAFSINELGHHWIMLYGLLPIGHQGITLTSTVYSYLGPSGTKLNAIWINIQHNFAFKNTHLKISAKWWPFCLRLIVLNLPCPLGDLQEFSIYVSPHQSVCLSKLLWCSTPVQCHPCPMSILTPCFHSQLSAPVQAWVTAEGPAAPHGTGIIFCMPPANERPRYIVTWSLIGWAHTGNDLW